MKKLIFLLTFFICLTGCNTKTATQSREENSASSIQEVNQEEQEEETLLSKEEVIVQITKIIEENISDLEPTINFDEKNNMINITVAAPDGTANAMNINPDTILEEWNTFCDALKGITETGYHFALENEQNIACTVMVLSDANKNNALYAAMNGVEMMNSLSR